MSTRRDFLKQSAAFSAGVFGFSLDTVRQAMAIAPDPGTTFEDAEHVVILMQENRSFDHAYGTLRGVRGFNDPRAIQLPNGDPAFVQSTAEGQRHAPFRLDIKGSKTTWMGCLPHNWPDQVDAANGGKHDKWLITKKTRSYPTLPLTMGYHTRDDIPFYYALADAFTICDQNFCSTLTGTTSNRLHLWTGTVRAEAKPDAPAFVRNDDTTYGSWHDWTTFPERLEDAGVSWAIYQNEVTVPTGLGREEDAWLSNFGCSPLEWFTQFGVRFLARHRAYLERRVKELPDEIAKLEQQATSESGETAVKTRKKAEEAQATLELYAKDLKEFTAENFEKSPARMKSLHEKAFRTNAADPAFRELTDLKYTDGKATRSLKVPKGDVLYQFRKDVAEGKLPTVSWIVPSERLSDHPCSAWYGQWYLSEILKILTQNPAVWKKTIFILTYDENDGYFDHVPPFQAPHPTKPETGRTSAGLNTALDWLEESVDRKHRKFGQVRGNSLGLGFRVPLVIASPWTRGGRVCSQVFDHTSVIQFLEKFATVKVKKKVEETNITKWRRTVCGDLTSAFRLAPDSTAGLKEFVNRDEFVEAIHKAQFQQIPTGMTPLSAADLKAIVATPKQSRMPRQEPGTRESCPLPYELDADGNLNEARDAFVFRFGVGNRYFGERAAGAPFIVYAKTAKGVVVRHFTVSAGKELQESWPLADFEGGRYSFRVHGPNGFYREFQGSKDDPAVSVTLAATSTKAKSNELTGGVSVRLANRGEATLKMTIRDGSYGHATVVTALAGKASRDEHIDTPASQGWYDVIVTVAESPGFSKHYAGRVETGRTTISDPAMA